MSSLPVLPALHGYWDITYSKKGDTTQRPILYAVGAALVTWELLDSNLADLFTIFVRCPTPAAQRAYGTIVTHKARCEMLAAAAEIFFRVNFKDKGAKEFFVLLMRHCEAACRMRNKIAHGISLKLGTKFFRVKKSGLLAKKPRYKWYGYFLVPAFYNTGKRHAYAEAYEDEFTDFLSKYRYTSADIMKLGAKFDVLARAAFNYCLYLDQQNRFGLRTID